MADQTVPRLTAQFDEISQRMPDEGIEFWFARDLMEPLGYARWENFTTAIQRAIESCKSTGCNEDDHFRGVTKMVPLGSGAECPVDDFMLIASLNFASSMANQNLGNGNILAGTPSFTRAEAAPAPWASWCWRKNVSTANSPIRWRSGQRRRRYPA